MTFKVDLSNIELDATTKATVVKHNKEAKTLSIKFKGASVNVRVPLIEPVAGVDMDLSGSKILVSTDGSFIIEKVEAPAKPVERKSGCDARNRDSIPRSL